MSVCFMLYDLDAFPGLKDERQEKQYGDFGTGQDIRNNLLWAGGSKGLRGVSKELWHLIAGSGKEAGL